MPLATWTVILSYPIHFSEWVITPLPESLTSGQIVNHAPTSMKPAKFSVFGWRFFHLMTDYTDKIMDTPKRNIEIMAPAGSFASLQAALKAGAGSVYFGVGKLNMRARSANFQLSDLAKIASLCRQSGVKSYLTMNTVVYDEEFAALQTLCDQALEAGVSAIIAMDIAVINYARKIGLEVHMSTQVNISNYEAVAFYAQFADVVVLAREVTLERIQHICHQIELNDLRGPSGQRIRIEVFVHGALCIAISGKCGMSLAQFDKSANRGSCYQNCRRSYDVTDTQTGDSLKIDNRFVMSPSDLCTLGMLDKLIQAGVSVLKIEGRGRSADYVYTVVHTYKQAVADILAGQYTEDKKEMAIERVNTVFNRGFWQGGYYMGIKTDEWARADGSKATLKKIQVGLVTNYFRKIGVSEIKVQASGFKTGETLLVTGPTTGAMRFEAGLIHRDGEPEESCQKGQMVGLPVPQRVRRNDKIYVLREVLQ